MITPKMKSAQTMSMVITHTNITMHQTKSLLTPTRLMTTILTTATETVTYDEQAPGA